jgi:transcriptional regulator with XRE-family HTH domain
MTTSNKGIKRLKAWMKKEGISEAEAARRIGVSRQVLNKWMRGAAMQRTSSLLLEHRTGINHGDFLVKGHN